MHCQVQKLTLCTFQLQRYTTTCVAVMYRILCLPCATRDEFFNLELHVIHVQILFSNRLKTSGGEIKIDQQTLQEQRKYRHTHTHSRSYFCWKRNVFKSSGRQVAIIWINQSRDSQIMLMHVHNTFRHPHVGNACL